MPQTRVGPGPTASSRPSQQLLPPPLALLQCRWRTCKRALPGKARKKVPGAAVTLSNSSNSVLCCVNHCNFWGLLLWTRVTFYIRSVILIIFEVALQIAGWIGGDVLCKPAWWRLMKARRATAGLLLVCLQLCLLMLCGSWFVAAGCTHAMQAFACAGLVFVWVGCCKCCVWHMWPGWA